jgi:hypothetical protein
MSTKRIHLHLSPEAIAAGKSFARSSGLRGISKAVERLLLASQPRRKKSFSERFGGRVKLRKPGRNDPRGRKLAEKHA